MQGFVSQKGLMPEVKEVKDRLTKLLCANWEPQVEASLILALKHINSISPPIEEPATAETSA